MTPKQRLARLEKLAAQRPDASHCETCEDGKIPGIVTAYYGEDPPDEKATCADCGRALRTLYVYNFGRYREPEEHREDSTADSAPEAAAAEQPQFTDSRSGASARRFTCSHCGEFLIVWDDGRPYYLDENGDKQYPPRRDPLFKACTGTDSPYMCLTCGEEFFVDSQAPVSACPSCDSQETVEAWHLDGKRCPTCKVGTFEICHPRIS